MRITAGLLPVIRHAALFFCPVRLLSPDPLWNIKKARSKITPLPACLIVFRLGRTMTAYFPHFPPEENRLYPTSIREKAARARTNQPLTGMKNVVRIPTPIQNMTNPSNCFITAPGSQASYLQYMPEAQLQIPGISQSPA